MFRKLLYVQRVRPTISRITIFLRRSLVCSITYTSRTRRPQSMPHALAATSKTPLVLQPPAAFSCFLAGLSAATGPLPWGGGALTAKRMPPCRRLQGQEDLRPNTLSRLQEEWTQEWMQVLLIQEGNSSISGTSSSRIQRSGTTEQVGATGRR